ncbi:DNA-binding response OmpR family regulator [Paenibacillus sp. DS2015]|uniref:response regulator transcription factor n=1 Tax=Paenibacillus sp. DS2015 TaxID=3373917 RepID=UPI003D2323E4
MPNILIVEDDIALNHGIVLSLKQDSFVFIQAFTVKQAREYLNNSQVDLIILDVNLPDGNGFDLCQEIRKNSAVPIIFLTANDLELDVVTGLELGGDDYITKPFSLMILRARVSSILRRATQKIVDQVIIDDFVFDFGNMKFYKHKQELVLSKTEQRLLRVLILNKGTILSRAILVDKIWTEDSEYVDENALSVTVNRLRNKLETYPSKPQYIQMVYGLGYTWAVE